MFPPHNNGAPACPDPEHRTAPEADTGTRDGDDAHQRNVTLRRMYQQLADAAAAAQAGGDDHAAASLHQRMQDVLGQFVTANYGLAAALAHQVRRLDGSTSSDDYTHDALVGMLTAFHRWDPDRSRFSVFAHYFMKDTLKRGLRSEEFHGLSVGDVEARPTVIAAEQRLTRMLGRRPSDAEVAAASGQSEALVGRVRRARPVSLDAPVGDDGGTVADLLPAQADVSVPADLSDPQLADLTVDLTARELFVLLRVQGLDGAPPQNYVELADDTGLGRMSVSAAHKQALAKVAARARQLHHAAP